MNKLELILNLVKFKDNIGETSIICCNFSEFVTAYLGEELPTKYHFGNIISILPRPNIGIFQDEYWFGHRINHGSGHHRNCEILFWKNVSIVVNKLNVRKLVRNTSSIFVLVVMILSKFKYNSNIFFMESTSNGKVNYF